MVNTRVNGMEHSLGYIAYQDLGNKRYKQALDKITKRCLGQEKTGYLVECIMGIGYLFQTHKCDKMKGIMELV
eukprot:6099083-Heterocapsa_arctica.AAC.1